MVTYKIGGKTGKKISLKEANDLVVVRFKDKKDFNNLDLNQEARSLVNNLMLVQSLPEANVNVYRSNAIGDKSAKKIRNLVRKMSQYEDDIRFSGRVLIDNKGVVNLYTENIFIKFYDNTKKNECESVLRDYNLSIKKKVTYAKNAYFVESKQAVGLEVFPLSEELLGLEFVELCHPEIIKQKKYKAAYKQQWHLKKTTFLSASVDAHIDVKSAWKHTRGKGIIIAVIDDAIDIDHPEFDGNGKIVASRNMAKQSSDPRPKSRNQNHGTSCAGVACALGIHMASGVAPDSILMPIKLQANLGSMQEAEAFVWATDNGADIISCSWGPADGNWWDPSDSNHTNSVQLPDSTRLAIDYSTSAGRSGKGCIITWAAGNGRENTFFDGYASYEKVLAIAACNDTGKRAVYSDFGKEVFCSFPSGDFEYPLFNHPKPITPGIWTTDVMGEKGYNTGEFGNNPAVGDAAGNYTATFGGTSSACPGAAGVIALILSINPELEFEDVKDIIKQSCDKVDSNSANYDVNGHSIYYGYGRLNAKKAVDHSLKTIE